MAKYGCYQIQYLAPNGLGIARRADMLSQIRRTSRPDTDARSDRRPSREYIPSSDYNLSTNIIPSVQTKTKSRSPSYLQTIH
jgi:hypothetical protein